MIYCIEGSKKNWKEKQLEISLNHIFKIFCMCSIWGIITQIFNWLKRVGFLTKTFLILNRFCNKIVNVKKPYIVFIMGILKSVCSNPIAWWAEHHATDNPQFDIIFNFDFFFYSITISPQSRITTLKSPSYGLLANWLVTPT